MTSTARDTPNEASPQTDETWGRAGTGPPLTAAHRSFSNLDRGCATAPDWIEHRRPISLLVLPNGRRALQPTAVHTDPGERTAEQSIHAGRSPSLRLGEGDSLLTPAENLTHSQRLEPSMTLDQRRKAWRICNRRIEECPGFAGALRALGGMGGHVGAPPCC